MLQDILLQKIAEKVVGYIWDNVEERVRKKMDIDPVRQAFKRALEASFKQFETHYPQWAAELFDLSFFEHEGAPLLAQFLTRDGHPDPSTLAAVWADSLNSPRDRSTAYVRSLEPAAADFLESLSHALKSEPALQGIQDSRSLEHVADSIDAIRRKLEADRATIGTRLDYLRWVIEGNLYLDPRGTFQTQRQVQVKLNDVYISLKSRRDEIASLIDRRLFEQEMAELKLRIAGLPGVEAEEQLEHLLMRYEGNQRESARHNQNEVLELAEAVNRYDHIVILGDPGSGKTTLLRYLALKHAQASRNGQLDAGSGLGATRFPILIRIADFAERDIWVEKSLSDFLVEYCVTRECPRSGLADLLATELSEGNCFILLDGLDEIVSADDRRAVVRRIEDFVRRYGTAPNRFVVTSRIAGYRTAPLEESFVHYLVQEMDESQIRRFLELWCPAVEAAQTPDLSLNARQTRAQQEIESIMTAVRSAPGVHRLAANPLLLRTLALIHRTGAQLPQKRIELYKLAADTLARTWRRAQGVPESALVEDEFLTQLLSTLAYWLHVNKPTGIATEEEVYRVLGEEWANLNDLPWNPEKPNRAIREEVKNFLRAVREHTGLFVERAPQRYGFMHLTFEEYYTARFLISSSKQRVGFISKHLHDPRWDEPILLALGFVGLDSPRDATELLETAILSHRVVLFPSGFDLTPYVEILRWNYLFALRCLGDQIPASPKLMRQLMEQLANELLYKNGVAAFQRYEQALNERVVYLKASKGAAVLAPLLIAALSYTKKQVSSRAAGILGELGQVSDEVSAGLLKALGDSDAGVRGQAALSLGQSGQVSDEVIAGLLEALERGKDWVLRNEAARLIGEISSGEEMSIHGLWRGLLDEDYDVRMTCAVALATLGQRIPSLVETIAMKLKNALDDPEFDKTDIIMNSSGHNYAFSGLWLLVGNAITSQQH